MPRSSEPSFEALLADDIVRDLMIADGVRVDELRALLRSVQHGLAQRTSPIRGQSDYSEKTNSSCRLFQIIDLAARTHVRSRNGDCTVLPDTRNSRS